MGTAWANWWGNADYLRHLEATIADLRTQCARKDQKIDELMDRLLVKEQVPPTPKQKIEIDREMTKINEDLRDQQFDIWADLDGGDDDEDRKATNEVQELVSDTVGR